VEIQKKVEKAAAIPRSSFKEKTNHIIGKERLRRTKAASKERKDAVRKWDDNYSKVLMEEGQANHNHNGGPR